MSEPAPTGRSGSRTLLIGAGIGCGCLGLLAAALVVVLIVIGVASRSGGGSGAPAGPGQPPAVPRGGGQPPQVPGPPGAPPQAGVLRVTVTMVRVDQNHQPVGETDVFRAGEEVGALARLEAIPQALDLRTVWVRAEGDHVVPVVPPKPLPVTTESQGKQIVFYLRGAPAGQYAFVIFLPGEGDQIQVVMAQKFAIQ